MYIDVVLAFDNDNFSRIKIRYLYKYLQNMHATSLEIRRMLTLMIHNLSVFTISSLQKIVYGNYFLTCRMELKDILIWHYDATRNAIHKCVDNI